jgi:hypothetical protein
MVARKRLELPKEAFRSSLTTGRDLFRNIDGRSDTARRYRDIQALIAADIGGGSSSDTHSEAQIQLIRSAAGLIVLRERLDTASINGEPIDTAQYCRIVNSLGRVLGQVGIKRLAEVVTVHLLRYAERYSKAEDADVEEAAV